MLMSRPQYQHRHHLILMMTFIVIMIYLLYLKYFGSIKLIVSCDIVNPAFYSLEVGDVIEFDENNMYPPTPMGHNSGTWDGLKMMITSTNRTLGRMGITAREI